MTRENRYRRWTKATVIAAVKRWHKLYKEPPRQSDWDPAACRIFARMAQEKAQDWLIRAAEYEASNDWPPARHVADLFGSWNEAIRAAGLLPRSVGQRTRRGVTPSRRMAVFGHVVTAVYAAEAVGDEVGLRRALKLVAEVSTRLSQGMGDDELTEYAFNLGVR